MLKNYLKIAFRSLKKHKGFSFINISGLSIGFTCCLLISIYINDELSYDKYHRNSEKIYRLTREFISPDGSTSLHLARLAPPFVPLLKTDFPEMETMTRFIEFGGPFRYEDKVFVENEVAWSDNDIFKVFTFEFIAGNPETALQEKGSMVITDEVALKYFGTLDALGKLIKFNNQASLKITGVIKPMPENSHFNLKMIGDFGLVEEFYGGRENMMQAWGSNNFSTYFILKEGSQVSEIERRFPDFLIKHLGENAINWTALHVQKMTAIHLHSHLDDELGDNSDIKYVYIFTAIGILILLIAIINYMNLSTAKSANRAKEVGVRKVLGADKPTIINQFITESILLVLISMGLALIITNFSLPFLRTFTDKQLVFTEFQTYTGIVIVFVFSIIIGLLAGSYPAFYLSSFEPLNVLKGKLVAGMKSSGIRRILVVIQFTISTILIASTMVIYQQLSFIQNKKLGYKTDHVLTIQLGTEINTKLELFKNQLTSHPNIDYAASSSRIPSIQLLDSQYARAEVNGESITPEVVIKNLQTDHDFMDTYDMELVAGRKFDRTIQSDDSTAYILNQAAVKMIGWPSEEDAIGKEFIYSDQKGKVIGVAKDIHFESLQNAINPLVMYIPRRSPNWLSIKMKGNDIQRTLNFVEKTWNEHSPNSPIQYRFIDDRFESLYESEGQRSNLFSGFSLLAIFLACMGLFGLASFTVSQRAKEISIRKVLGASVTTIINILSKEFLLLVTISVVIAVPIALYFMSDWLNNYAYRIDLNALPFILAGCMALFIALFTISLQTIKAATSNPVDALKEE